MMRMEGGRRFPMSKDRLLIVVGLWLMLGGAISCASSSRVDGVDIAITDTNLQVEMLRQDVKGGEKLYQQGGAKLYH